MESTTKEKERKRRVRVLMLTWEYPPRIVGGISRVVEGLSQSLTKIGVEVHVITTNMPGSPAEEDDKGIKVHRVPVETPAPNFHSWILLMNHFFSKRIGTLVQEVGGFDIIHVHDWLVLPSGSEAKHFLSTALVSTLHSLEFKRSSGVNTPESQMVDSLEWWCTYESEVIVVCSGSMKQDAKSRFGVGDAKIWVIPIGVNPEKFRVDVNRDAVRTRYGIGPADRLILFIGRLTHQKGCEYLIRAIPSVAKYHNARLVIVGDGYQRGELEGMANTTGERWRMQFTGFLPDSEVVELMKSSDVMVIPSVYEPFGVVALEAMAAGVPVVASDVDGLGEIIKHEHNGILVYPRDSGSVSWGISRVLSDSNNTKRIVENAKQDVTARYSWDAIARLTLEAYLKARGINEQTYIQNKV